MLQYFQNREDCTHVNYPCEYWVTGTESLETSVNLADFFEDVKLEWNLRRGAGDQPRLIQGIRSGDGVGDLFI